MDGKVEDISSTLAPDIQFSLLKCHVFTHEMIVMKKGLC